MDTKKKRVFKIIKDVALYVWMCIKGACIGFVVSTLTCAFTLIFCKTKGQRIAAAIGAFALGSAAAAKVAEDDATISELTDDIVNVIEKVKERQEAENEASTIVTE